MLTKTAMYRKIVYNTTTEFAVEFVVEHTVLLSAKSKNSLLCTGVETNIIQFF